jgi:hypothetical protein
MKINAEKLYLLSSAALTVALATTSASANKPTIAFNAPNSLNDNATYTASGKMDRKTAVMLTNLLRNPHLQVRAKINGQPLQTISPKPAMKNPINILANYTITGKTDRKTVLRLKKLLQNNQHLQIQAEANFNNNTQRVVTAPKIQNHNRFIAGYTPFYSKVTPPAYVQGNTVWVPVLINEPI